MDFRDRATDLTHGRQSEGAGAREAGERGDGGLRQRAHHVRPSRRRPATPALAAAGVRRPCTSCVVCGDVKANACHPRVPLLRLACLHTLTASHRPSFPSLRPPRSLASVPSPRLSAYTPPKRASPAGDGDDLFHWEATLIGVDGKVYMCVCVVRNPPPSHLDHIQRGEAGLSTRRCLRGQ